MKYVNPLDLDLSPRGIARMEGVLRNRVAEEFNKAVAHLHVCVWEWKRVESLGIVNIVQLLHEFDNTLTVCLARATTVVMPFQDVQHGVAELQQAWLYSIALLDWAKTFRIESDQTRAEQ
ncbi:hypothetical protein PM082_020046 [Marasmius tenuissimus]|nr:hypothetical protein PM082_020046 [Marasmius tenuissimus]